MGVSFNVVILIEPNVFEMIEFNKTYKCFIFLQLMYIHDTIIKSILNDKFEHSDVVAEDWIHVLLVLTDRFPCPAINGIAFLCLNNLISFKHNFLIIFRQWDRLEHILFRFFFLLILLLTMHMCSTTLMYNILSCIFMIVAKLYFCFLVVVFEAICCCVFIFDSYHQV